MGNQLFFRIEIKLLFLQFYKINMLILPGIMAKRDPVEKERFYA